MGELDMSTVHSKVLNITRTAIAGLLLIAIWAYPGVLSSVCASIGTVMWLFLPAVVRVEERAILTIKGYFQ